MWKKALVFVVLCGFVVLALSPPSNSALPVKYGNRIKETTTTTGTGAMTLGGADALHVAFSTLGDGAKFDYAIDDGASSWEVGQGTYNLGANTVSRDVVEASSNGGALVSFGAGTKTIIVGTAASRFNNLETLNTQKVFNVKAYGAKGDVPTAINDGSITTGTAILTSPSNPWVAADVGKSIAVLGAGSAGNNNGVANVLMTTILSFQNAGQVTLNANATNTVSGTAGALWGTLDSTAINAATSAANAAGGGIVYFPGGTYFIDSAIILYTEVHLKGAGIVTTKLQLAPGSNCDIIQSNGFASLTGTNSTGGINSCSIRDMSISGYNVYSSTIHNNISGAHSRSTTTLTLTSNAAFPASGTVLVYDNSNNLPGEIISYTGKGGGTQLTGCVRGLENTIPQTFQGGESVDLRVSVAAVQPGYGVRIYGYGFIVENVMISSCAQDGWYSEWSNSTPELGPDGYQSKIINLKCHNNNGHGINFEGPHDSIIITSQAMSNSMHGVRVVGGAGAGTGGVSGTKFMGCHSSGLQNYSYSLEGFCLLFNCVGEQGIAGQCYINTSQTQVVGGRFFCSPSQVFARGIVLGANVQGCVIDAALTGCNGGSIDLTGDAGNNYIRLQIQQQAGGNLFVGTPHPASNVMITQTPENVDQLTGNQFIASGPGLIRSGQSGQQTLITRGPFNLTSNLIEGQLSVFPGTTAPITSTVFAVSPNGLVGSNTSSPTAAFHAAGGGIKAVGLATPGTPIGTAFGGSGTNKVYFVVAKDIAGNKTIPSASVTVSGGTTLSSSVWNRIQAIAVTGAYSYDILKTDTNTLLGTITPNAGGKITRINVGAGGSGYTGGAPAIGVAGVLQNTPIATATVAANAVTAVNVSAGAIGDGFTSVPTVIVGGPGSGAAVTAVMGVSNILSVGAGGSGYTVGDEITETGGTSTTAAVLKVTSVSAGAVTAVSVKTQGAYSALPANPVAQGSTDGAGTGATFNITWGVCAYTVTNGGTGYSTAPSIGLAGGGALPTMTAILTTNAVSGISVLNGTAFFLSTPTIVVQGMAAGSGATATASLSSLFLDDVGQSTSAYTNPLRNATADATFDGAITASDLINTPYVSTSHEFMRHYEAVTSAAATLATTAGIARTVTSAVAATNQKNARGEWLRISATTTGAVSSLVAGTFTETQLQAQPVFNTRVEIPTAIVNMRVMIGLTSGAMVQTTDTQSTLHTAYFRYSTNVPDTKWQCCTSNASATTVIDSGITVVADTTYKLRIDCTDNTRLKFFINDSLVAVATATLPTATTGIAPEHSLTSLTNTGQKDLDMAYTAIWQ